MHDFCENYSKSKNSKKKKHSRASYNPPQSTESQKKKEQKRIKNRSQTTPNSIQFIFLRAEGEICPTL